MLALADHARDDGSHVYPSMALLAWKSSYSLRQVKRIVDELRRLTVLTVVARARRGRPTEYKINLEAVPAKPILARKSDIAAPQSRNNEVSSKPVPVTFPARSGDIFGHIEPLEESSIEPEPGPLQGGPSDPVLRAAVSHTEVAGRPDTRHRAIKAVIEQQHLMKFRIDCEWDGREERCSRSSWRGTHSGQKVNLLRWW